jgi:DNA-binding Lrp family transcriptional regulator
MSESKTFIGILPFMVKDLNLKGNELIIFAIIYGFCQDGKSKFWGSINYLMEQTGISRRAVIYILDRLVKNGLLIREEEYMNDKVYPTYAVCNSCTGGAKIALRGAKIAQNRGAKIAPNNKQDNNKEDTTYQSFADAYNRLCPSLPKAIKITDKRRGHLNAVVKEFGAEGVMEALAKVESCPHLVGKNDRGWKADFDWLINKNNLLKVIEGRYDKKKKLKEGDDGYYENDIAW